MYRKISVVMTSFFIGKNELNNYNKDVLVYGAELLISSIMEMFLVLVLGAALNRWNETVYFLLFFCPLRSMAGGYHANSYTSCTISFLFFYSVLCIWLRPIAFLVRMLMVISSVIVILLLAPVEDENKLLRGKRREIVRKRCLLVLAIEIVLYGSLCYILREERVIAYVSLSFCVVASLVVIGKLKNMHLFKGDESISI